MLPLGTVPFGTIFKMLPLGTVPFGSIFNAHRKMLPNGTVPFGSILLSLGLMTEKHPFEPFLPDNARLLFLGSFPPQPHRWCMPFYYPNWINDFWRIMGLIHFNDKDHFCIIKEKRFNEPQIRGFCTQNGLAFYDTATEVKRLKDNASDAFLEVITPTDIPELLQKIPLCTTIVTTGQKATEVIAQTFNCPIPPIGSSIGLSIEIGTEIDTEIGTEIGHNKENARIARQITFYRMPSTSRAYPLPLNKKADAYRQLF